jgi:hypothetical protein
VTLPRSLDTRTRERELPVRAILADSPHRASATCHTLCMKSIASPPQDRTGIFPGAESLTSPTTAVDGAIAPEAASGSSFPVLIADAVPSTHTKEAIMAARKSRSRSAAKPAPEPTPEAIVEPVVTDDQPTDEVTPDVEAALEVIEAELAAGNGDESDAPTDEPQDDGEVNSPNASEQPNIAAIILANAEAAQAEVEPEPAPTPEELEALRVAAEHQMVVESVLPILDRVNAGHDSIEAAQATMAAFDALDPAPTAEQVAEARVLWQEREDAKHAHVTPARRIEIEAKIADLDERIEDQPDKMKRAGLKAAKSKLLKELDGVYTVSGIAQKAALKVKAARDAEKAQQGTVPAVVATATGTPASEQPATA